FAGPAIARQVKQLRRLVDDLLNMARITSGKLTLRREPVELLAFAQRVIGEHRGLATGDALIEVQGAPARVDADPARLEQMIENLVDNATKYGGRHIVVTVSRNERCGRLAVRDDGQGIAPELQKLLFKPFVQGVQPPQGE